MKKFAVCMLLALFLLPGAGSFARAQVTKVELTPEARQELITTITAQIQQLLIQMIVELQAEIQQLITAQVQVQQNTASTTVVAMDTASSTAGTLAPAPAPAPRLGFSIQAEYGGGIFTDSSGNIVREIKVVHVPKLQFIGILYNVPNDAATGGYRYSYEVHITTDYPGGFDRPGGGNDPNGQWQGFTEWRGHNYALNMHPYEHPEFSGDYTITFEVPELGLSETVPFSIGDQYVR